MVFLWAREAASEDGVYNRGNGPTGQVHALAAADDNKIFAAGSTWEAFLGFPEPRKNVAAFVLELLSPPDTPASCAGYAATILGTSGPDVLTGSLGQDVIVAGGSDDSLPTLVVRGAKTVARGALFFWHCERTERSHHRGVSLEINPIGSAAA